MPDRRRLRADLRLLQTISAALKGPFQLTITYRGASDADARERLVEPHGLLLGTRRYLIARSVDGDRGMRQFRLDRISSARLEAQSFTRDPEFDLATHAGRAFGSYHTDTEFGKVIWRFSPDAADVAREFVFHPNQDLTDENDGSLTVRFQASGHLEMAWHLYQWGDAVEVIAPKELRSLIEDHRRSDFPAFP